MAVAMMAALDHIAPGVWLAVTLRLHYSCRSFVVQLQKSLPAMQPTSTGPYWGSAITWGKISGYDTKLIVIFSYF